MHATKMRPVAVDGKVEVRPVMYLALTYDHRLIDGRYVLCPPCPRRLLWGGECIAAPPVLRGTALLRRTHACLQRLFSSAYLALCSEAVTFLCSIRDKVEDPARLLLDL
jgi:hypothetical protein